MSDSLKRTSQQPSVFVPEFEHLALDNLRLKIAETPEEIRAAQKLRYDVFYTEMGAHPTPKMIADGFEEEAYDPYCQHLLVVDNTAPIGRHIVGTYRILHQEPAESLTPHFYTQTEFDLTKLRATGGSIVEVSRSCVLQEYRSRMVINLLWRGIAAYVFGNDIDYLIGTPSLTGTDLLRHEASLGYLNAFHAAPEHLRPRVLDAYYHALPSIDKTAIDQRKAFASLPPLLKGYLRIGATIADGAFIDHQFNCIDIAIVVSLKEMDQRYLNYYKRS